MKYFLVAGEASGDLHASRLMSELKKQDSSASFRFLGGDKMAKASGENPIRHYREMNFMGIFTVLANLGKISDIMKEARRSIEEWKPDVLVLVDYAGFNLRLAKHAFLSYRTVGSANQGAGKGSLDSNELTFEAGNEREKTMTGAGFVSKESEAEEKEGGQNKSEIELVSNGAEAESKELKIFYYITPKVWAWKKKRIEKLRKYCTKLFVIFPFEKDYFQENGMEVEYVGNPLTDAHREFEDVALSKESFYRKYQLDDRPLVALLAGSRNQEIKLLLPEMEKAAGAFPDCQFVLAGAPSVEKKLYENILESADIKLIENDTYNLLSHADAAIVTSGTATLETALFEVPQVVVYKTGNLTYRIGKLFVSFRFFSLVNLIFGKELVKELLQYNLVEQIKAELDRLLHDEGYKEEMILGYKQIKDLLGSEGASHRAAVKMIELLS